MCVNEYVTDPITMSVQYILVKYIRMDMYISVLYIINYIILTLLRIYTYFCVCILFLLICIGCCNVAVCRKH